jgi:zinc protease
MHMIRLRMSLLMVIVFTGLAARPAASPAAGRARMHAASPADTAGAYQWVDSTGSRKPIKTLRGISECNLANGLQVLLCPDPSRPRVTVVVTYGVGSRHEGPGEAGMAHMLEHMMFRGSRDFDSAHDALNHHGADYNAMTWFDLTYYCETLAATDENLEFALRLEADRMTNATLDSGALANEIGVITNEVEMMENDPAIILSQRMLSAAYLWHSYGRTTVGNVSDLQRYNAADLRRFYEKHYRPDNAALFVGGRFDVGRALDLIDEYFGSIPGPTHGRTNPYTVEPVQEGSRLVHLVRAGSPALAGLVYHVPAGAHPDAAALSVLHNILTNSPSGRLHRALVEPGLASAVDEGDPDLMLLTEPGLFEVIIQGAPGQDIHELAGELSRLVEGVGLEPVTDREVELAKARLMKKMRPFMNDAGALGIYLANWVVLGDWSLFFVHRERLRRVRRDDVERVARTYLVESNRTAGVFVPTESPALARVPRVPPADSVTIDAGDSGSMSREEVFETTPDELESRTLKVTIEPGIGIAFIEKPSRGHRVCVHLRLHYGSSESLAGRQVAAGLLPDLLMRGTRALDYQGLRDTIDLLQCELEISGHLGLLEASIDTDGERLPSTLGLLAEILREPRFDESQFDMLKAQRLAQIESEQVDPVRLSVNTLQRGLQPWAEGNAHCLPTLAEETEMVKQLSLSDVADLYESLIGASHVELSIVGEFDKGEVLAALGDAFGTWRSPAPYERIERPYRPVEAGQRTVHTPGKQMAMVTLATLLNLNDSDPDYPALRVATYVLTEGGQSRLEKRLRHGEGLSYHTGGRIEAGTRDERANIYAYAFCSSADARLVLDIMREEVQEWIEAGITNEELALSKQILARQTELDLSDDVHVARELARGLETGRSMSYHSGLLEKIDRLSVRDVRLALRERLKGRAFLEILAGDLKE